MGGSLFFYVNGTPHRVGGPDAFDTLSNFLRYRLRATGTKIVCEEGDCGACSVLVGRPDGERLEYRPVNSCIQFLHQVNGTHVVTVEGLGNSSDLHPVQEAMVRWHGAQCGFCTPGFIVAMCAMYETSTSPTEETVRAGLTGNLCRCTGYEPIIRAGLDVDTDGLMKINEMFPPAEIVAALRAQASEPLRIETDGRIFFSPVTLDQAVAFRSEHPGAVIVQGGTDIVVQHNKRGFDPRVIVSLSNIPELATLSIMSDVLSVGAAVSLTDLYSAVAERAPELAEILELFGAPQIRHAGTLAGNIANASPIADTLPFLYVMGAELEIAGPSGLRLVPIESFFLGYKKLDMRDDELIARVLIPLAARGEGEILRLYKISKRKNLDISTVTAAIRMWKAGGRIDRAMIAFGGVGPVVLRLRRVEDFLRGKEFSLETFLAAGEIVRGEITPISDVRGSAEFRLQLAGNLMLKFFYQSSEDSQPEASFQAVG